MNSPVFSYHNSDQELRVFPIFISFPKRKNFGVAQGKQWSKRESLMEGEHEMLMELERDQSSFDSTFLLLCFESPSHALAVIVWIWNSFQIGDNSDIGIHAWAG